MPDVPTENIILEPCKKDVGPAVAYAVAYVSKMADENEPIVILWSDHIVKHQVKFKQILVAAEQFIAESPNKIVFIGQKPRFASENSFTGFKYRPKPELAQEYFTSGRHCWNLGYFVTTPANLMQKFATFTPEISTRLSTILSHFQMDDYDSVLNTEYSQFPEVNFDNAVLEKLSAEDAVVAVEDIGWSDVGAWEALKEALEKDRQDTVTLGNVLLQDSNDSLVYNYEDQKLVVGIDLDELLVINTKDALLVTKKTSVAKVKSLVESFKGTEHEDLT